MASDDDIWAGLIERLQGDLRKANNQASVSALRHFFEGQQETDFGRMFAATAVDKIDRGEAVEAIAEWCCDLVRWYAVSYDFSKSLSDRPTDKEQKRSRYKAANASRDLNRGLSQFQRIKSISDAFERYYGRDSKWPEPISDADLEKAESLIERALEWNKLIVQGPTHWTPPKEIEKRKPGRPTKELIRDCEVMVSNALLSAGLQQRRVARYTHELMRCAGMEPGSWQSVEQRLIKRRGPRN